MTNLTGTNYRFDAGDFYHGLYGIYNAVHYLLNRGNQISAEQSHKQTVDYYFQHKKENDYGWGEDAQRQILAIFNDVMICVITRGENEPTIQVSYYGENPSLGKKFIYMLYDETTLYYYPLYANDEGDSLNEFTTFIHNNTVKNLLGVFVRDRFHYTGEIDFGDILVKYVSTSMNDDLTTILDSTLINGSQKRKRPGVDDISLSSNGNQLLSPTNSINDDDDNHDLNKRTKFAHSPSDHTTQSNKKYTRTKAIGSLIRTDGESDADSPVNEQEIENSSVTFNDEHHEEKSDLDILAQFNSEMDSFISKSMPSNEETETRFLVFE